MRRVAITGMGVVCPLGNSVSTTWAELLAGRSVIGPVSRQNAATGTVLTVPGAVISDSMLKPIPKSIEGMADKFGRLAIMASIDAVADAKLDFSTEDRGRIGTSSGTCMGGICETEIGFDAIYLRRRPKVHPFTVVRTMYNNPVAFISSMFGLTGPALAFSTTCSSSAVAIGEAARQIRHGYADVMIAGGSEALFTYSALNCWYSAQLLAPVHDEPTQSCRPFDATRNGTALGEGAIFYVLEDWERAVRRGSRIHAELLGYACTTDSLHVTQPSAAGQASSMRSALADAGIPPSEIGYIHAHGTGTKLNDKVETSAIKSVFEKHAYNIPISSSKSMVGHMVGAAGAMGLLASIQAICNQEVPPTANLQNRDPDCDLDYVPVEGRREIGLRTAMSNAFGFGGTSASLIVRLPQ